MRGWTTGMALGLWLAGPGAAQAEPADSGCAELRAIVAAAQERPPFRSMPHDIPRPALGFANCEVLSGFLEGDPPRFICIGDHPQSLRRWQEINAGILRCLPGVERYEDPRGTPPRVPDRDARFRIGRAVILVSEAGYANVPQRYVAIHIEAAPER